MNMRPALVPYPAQLTAHPGTFRLSARPTISGPDEASTALQLLRGALPAPAVPAAAPEITIWLATSKELSLGPEGYRLTINTEGIGIVATASAGFLYAAQTLLQLLPPDSLSDLPQDDCAFHLPYLEIEDRPRFGWRGMMLDVARHFLPMHEVIHMVNLAVHHKLNVLHLHLTDDQGWRFESLRYPRLTQVGGFRKATVNGRNSSSFKNQPYGGFYTQSELKRLVKYAADRNVTIVPEIDMPGHMVAAIAAYPELGDGVAHEVLAEWGVSPHVLNLKDETVQFCRDILTEIMEVFPSPYIHVGGDECPRDQWLADPAEQSRMTGRGVNDVEKYQSWFMHQMDEFLTSHGRRMVGWDEILEGGLAPGAVVMSWRGVQGGVTAAMAGHDVVMSPMSHVYLDYYSSSDPSHPLAIGGYLPLEVVHRWEPVAFGLDSEHEARILGTQGNLWSEYMPNPADVRRMAFPRMSALAEVAWSPRNRPNYADFRYRMNTHLHRLHALGCPEAALPPADQPIGDFMLAEGETQTFKFPLPAYQGNCLLRVTCASAPGQVKCRSARIRQGDSIVAEETTAFHLWPVDAETLIKFSGLRMKGDGQLEIELTAAAQAHGSVFMSPA